MKKIIYCTILVLCVCLCGCGRDVGSNPEGNRTQETKDVENIPAESSTPMPTEIPTEAPTATPSPTPTPTVAPTEEPPKTSYITEDGAIIRMSSEQLQVMEESVMKIILDLPEEMPESVLTQDMLDYDTVQWFNTTYAVMMYQNDYDYTLVGGAEPGPSLIKYFLDRDWGVTDRATAIENIYWLLAAGHRSEYEQTIEEFKAYGLLDVPLEVYLGVWEASAQEQGVEFEDIRYYFENIYNAYINCGDVGIKAWDYCRIMQMCGSYYVSGYFTLEESMDISLATAQLMQAEYVSWEDMMNSFLHGYDYWRAENPDEAGTGSYWRHRNYEELYAIEGNPYVVNDWNVEFVKNW